MGNIHHLIFYTWTQFKRINNYLHNMAFQVCLALGKHCLFIAQNQRNSKAASNPELERPDIFPYTETWSFRHNFVSWRQIELETKRAVHLHKRDYYLLKQPFNLYIWQCVYQTVKYISPCRCGSNTGNIIVSEHTILLQKCPH